MRQTTENLAKIWRVPQLKDLELLKATSVNHVYARHWHETFVFEVVESGENGFYCEGRTFEAPAGSIIAINPYQVHTGYPLGHAPLTYRSMYPAPELLRNLASGISDSYAGVPHFSHPVITDPIFEKKIGDLHRTLEASFDPLEIESMFVSVISNFISKYSTESVSTEPIQNENAGVRRTRDYLQEHYSAEITLGTLAEISGLSSFHLLRSFRKAYGLPPFAFLMNLRIERAKQLLRRGRRISEVAQEIGFYDQSHLNRHFVRIAGVTPGRYRAISS